jgi:L-iditol 2-dehydrogenase
MKALLLTEYKKMSCTDVPDPVCAADEVLIEVRACGICGSDIHGYDGSTGRRIPPLVMGHEAAGVIRSVGSAVTRFKAGQRVTFDSTVYCGACAHCRRGDVNLCDNRQVLGVSCGDYRRHGAFAELVSVPERIVYAIPDELGFNEAAMIEAVSVGVHAVRLTPCSPGDTAVVIGTGMIGLLTLQAARIAGFSQVIAVDTEDSRLAVARELGATHAFNPASGDAAAFVKGLTQGQGADAVFECVGVNATVQSAVACVRKGGAVTLVGNLSPKVELPLQSVVTRQVRLQGSCASAGEYPDCIRLLASGRIRHPPRRRPRLVRPSACRRSRRHEGHRRPPFLSHVLPVLQSRRQGRLRHRHQPWPRPAFRPGPRAGRRRHRDVEPRRGQARPLPG